MSSTETEPAKLKESIGPLVQRTLARQIPPSTASYEDCAAWTEVARQIGPRYERARFSTFEQPTAKHKAVVEQFAAWCDQLPELMSRGAGGVVLFGTRGTGKDHLAVAGLRTAAIKHKLSVGWVEGQTLFARSRDLIDRDISEERWANDYVRPKVLLISDPLPQSGNLSEYQLSVMWRILDARYRKCHATWVTCNARDGADLSTRLGPALTDRLRDGALGLHCDWPTHRGAWEQRPDGTFGKKETKQCN